MVLSAFIFDYLIRFLQCFFQLLQKKVIYLYWENCLVNAISCLLKCQHFMYLKVDSASFGNNLTILCIFGDIITELLFEVTYMQKYAHNLSHYWIKLLDHKSTYFINLSILCGCYCIANCYFEFYKCSKISTKKGSLRSQKVLDIKFSDSHFSSEGNEKFFF